MPRVTHVKHARKDYPEHGIKKGDEYYWWAFMVGGRGGPKHFSKTPPKPSQLTQSEFLSQVYDLNERLENLEPGDHEELASELAEIAEEFREIASECEDKFNNMPEGLQQGDTGQLLEQRAEECNSLADELEGIDCEWDEEAALKDVIQEVVTTHENDDPERVDDHDVAHEKAIEIAADIEEHFEDTREGDLGDKVAEVNTYQGE